MMDIADLCKRCGTQLVMLATTNPWEYYCRTCDDRFMSVDCAQSLREHQSGEEWVRTWDQM